VRSRGSSSSTSGRATATSSGAGTARPPDVLEPDRARALLNGLLEEADVVVVNAPPLARSPSTLVWAHVADATLLVVRRGNSKREAVSDAVKSLSVIGASLIGTVLRERRRLSLARS
jgi:succinoglycan biosynthesis transport protein ExoP